jgi:hypothetical protein
LQDWEQAQDWGGSRQFTALTWLPTIEHGETAFDDGPWTIRVIPPVAFTRAVLDDCDEQVDAAFQPQLLPDRPAVSDVGTAETQVEPVVVEDDAAAWAFQPTMHLSREPGPAESVHGPPEAVDIARVRGRHASADHGCAACSKRGALWFAG